MSTLETERVEKRGGKRAGSGRKKREKKERSPLDNLKVRKSTQMKAQAIRQMTGKQIVNILDDLMHAEYLRVCELNNVEPQQFPNTEQEILEYNERIKQTLEQ